ncbi:PadR family transcriptional regulator [Marinicrinis lubricantis]|uniref:PadR family transcriptional regulator n=1 Tax=Marinicrinis lubricantis TaxID=2086470 RepID=A0ABW1IK19_9BACL
MRWYHHGNARRLHSQLKTDLDREDSQKPNVRFRHGEHKGGGGGKRRFFERGEFKFALLELLATEPMHGYQFIKSMEEKTGGLYSPSPGSIYPNLQLLEDMDLIRSSEAEGKKLYHITDKGLSFLRERRKNEAERHDGRWDRHRGHHRTHGGQQGKRELKQLMNNWSDIILLMAQAARAAEENPTSDHAEKFQALMTKLKGDLKEIVSSLEKAVIDESALPPAINDPLPEDLRQDEAKRFPRE